MGCGFPTVQQAAIGDCLSFDPFPFDQKYLAPPEVDVGGRQVADACVIAQVIIIGDEGLDLGFEIARQVVVLEQDPVLERLIPTLDQRMPSGNGRGKNRPAGQRITPPAGAARHVPPRRWPGLQRPWLSTTEWAIGDERRAEPVGMVTWNPTGRLEKAHRLPVVRRVGWQQDGANPMAIWGMSV